MTFLEPYKLEVDFSAFQGFKESFGDLRDNMLPPVDSKREAGGRSPLVWRRLQLVSALVLPGPGSPVLIFVSKLTFTTALKIYF